MAALANYKLDWEDEDQLYPDEYPLIPKLGYVFL